MLGFGFPASGAQDMIAEYEEGSQGVLADFSPLEDGTMAFGCDRAIRLYRHFDVIVRLLGKAMIVAGFRLGQVVFGGLFDQIHSFLQ